MKKQLKNHIHFFLLSILLTSFILPITAQVVPSDLMKNCNQWKITYPTGEEDKTLCDEPNNEFFYVNDTNNAIVFRAPIRSDNGTTPNSSNIRSELRERVADGTVDIYWTTEGSHMVYVKQAITHLPINKPHLVATQIHGNKDDGIDDAMVMRLENSHLFLSFNGGQLRDEITIKSNYSLGTIHEVIFLVVDGKHYCYYAEDGNLLNAYTSGDPTSYLIKADGNDFVMDLNYDQSYFKVGNYTQSNADEEGSDTDNPTNYGEVLVYDFYVEHDEDNVSSVELSPTTIDLLTNNTYQLSTSVKPTNAVDVGVSYSSSNINVATVDTNGLVTAVSEGSATITVTTNDGGFTDTTEINVVDLAIVPNLALNKSITGTGTADGDNVATNLVDGLTTTRWSVSGYPQTATIDLGSISKIDRTELVTYSERDYQYTIAVSNTENDTYTQIVDRSQNTSPTTEQNPNINLFSEIEARFVKITVTGSETYTGDWISLSELRVFGVEGDIDETDGDGDGILDQNDNCPNTPSGVSVDAFGCELLSSNNFNIEIIGETCPGENNGQLIVSPNETRDYQLTFNGENYGFSTEGITIENIATGTYEICIEVVGVTSPYCYVIEIAEATEISGKSNIENKQLYVQVSEGTLPYRVFVNGSFKFETFQNDFNFEVNQGDLIEVKTKNECEGIFSKEIEFFELASIYPNPSQGMFSIPVLTTNKKVEISVYNSTSQLVLSNTFKVQNSIVQLDLSHIKKGVYFVKIHLDKEYQFKIIKN
ncbi:MAG: T9SS type A sorting domain-containing protein [Lutibacter sp.]|uniref:polysaccharide lyase family 7 protein n=1 Tax=Lutibacter sp. TaxID=1925666 RepID=UPI0017E76117|nr:polysaccharide lyase family 7 protein [Lutibacter sp.]MBT8316309.1 polysaccharide lyase family 7 protein [Lutibacter sp.]NNJ57169.1 T9SS type A sorting domain-containing protein [Lutibacter sp.]